MHICGWWSGVNLSIDKYLCCYYDPTICRFINADNYELVAQLSYVPGELNMYTYCNNNPIMYTDPYGYIALSIGATALAGLIALFAISIEAIYHPVANIINEIGNTVGDIYREISIGNNLNALRTSTVGVNLTNFGLNFSRERNRGRDSGFIGVGDQELNDMLKDAKRRGDTNLIKRITAELKKRGQRNTKKQRGGPHMRGFFWLPLLLEDNNENS